MSFNLEDYLADLSEWSTKTFGPYVRTEGILDHIGKELKEIAQNPNDLEEWIDVLILAFDGGLSNGFSPAEIAACLSKKLEKNKARKWPDWRTAEPGKAIEHHREVCDRCGACSEEEATLRCKQTQDVTGEYSCPGSDLWNQAFGC